MIVCTQTNDYQLNYCNFNLKNVWSKTTNTYSLWFRRHTFPYTHSLEPCLYSHAMMSQPVTSYKVCEGYCFGPRGTSETGLFWFTAVCVSNLLNPSLSDVLAFSFCCQLRALCRSNDSSEVPLIPLKVSAFSSSPRCPSRWNGHTLGRVDEWLP